MSYKVLLVKILQEKYLEDFLDGKIFLNTIEYFKQLESDEHLRSDLHEGMESVTKFESISIQHPETQEWLEIKGAISPMFFNTQRFDYWKLLCLHMVTNKQTYVYSNKNDLFGDVAVFIADLPAFIDRLKQAANALDVTLHHAPVEYVSKDKHDGEMGPFRKFDTYQHQSEFRFLFEHNDSKSMTLNVGDIRDICFVARVSEIEKIISKSREGLCLQ